MFEKSSVFLFFAIIVFVFIFIANSLALAKGLPVPQRGFISSEPAESWEQGLISGNSPIANEDVYVFSWTPSTCNWGHLLQGYGHGASDGPTRLL
jgi:hypothetical protein